MQLIEKLPHVSRVALGLIFAVFGLNGFLHFLPQPPLAETAVPFISGLASAGYFFPLLKGVEVVAAVLLLTRTAVPFALVLLAPIIVNIAAFHTFLAPGAAAMTLLLVALELHLAWSERAQFAPLFARAPTARRGSFEGQPAPAAAE